MGSTWGNANDFTAVFRCTTSKYADDFVTKGEIKFSTPQSWVDWAKDYGDGRGDMLEGTVACWHLYDIPTFIELNKKYSIYKKYISKTTTIEKINKTIYFKRKRTMELPCFCFYILKNSMFMCPNKTGKGIELSTKIPASYFRDFAENKAPEEIKKRPDDKKPAVIYIESYKELEFRIINALIDLGLAREEILIEQIHYDNFKKYGPKGWIDLNTKEPFELFFKDNRFYDQSEARIVINTNKDYIKKFLIDKVLTLGPLTDISQKKDVYLYDGMTIILTAEVSDKPPNY